MLNDITVIKALVTEYPDGCAYCPFYLSKDAYFKCVALDKYFHTPAPSDFRRHDCPLRKVAKPVD